jgi:hypothetical protein
VWRFSSSSGVSVRRVAFQFVEWRFSSSSGVSVCRVAICYMDSEHIWFPPFSSIYRTTMADQVKHVVSVLKTALTKFKGKEI